MKKLRVIVSTAVLFGAVVTQSKADAIYEWRSTPSSPNPSAMSLTLIVSSAAIAAGRADFTYYGSDWHPGSSTDVKELGWSSIAGTGFPFKPGYSNPYTGIVVHLTLSPSGKAAGSISADDSYTLVHLSSDSSGLFSINAVGWDDGRVYFNCPTSPDCPPLPTGTIQKVGDVPEPGSLALIGLGLIGVGRFARRRT